jgi:glycosyltransferase involved in cell wall biosynthesis
VWHIHEILEKPNWLRRLIYPFIRAFSDQIIAVSQAVAYPITYPEHQSKIHVVWNGIDTDEFSLAIDGQSLRKLWGVNNNTVVFGVVGRISHWKGQELFLKAAARAARECENIYFILVGDPVPGDESRLTYLHRLAIDLKIAKQVRVTPFTDNIPQIMRALDILVLPSTLPEPLGLVILEAMASGRCVIAAAHGGPLETVEHNETGLLFPPNNVEALSAAMVELAIDSERRHSMGQKGRQRVEELFSLANFREKIIQIYTEILEETKQPKGH